MYIIRFPIFLPYAFVVKKKISVYFFCLMRAPWYSWERNSDFWKGREKIYENASHLMQRRFGAAQQA
jgi:hypothetical protein